jgi:hypothetical protein
MTGDELPLSQFAEPVPYLVMDAQEESVPDYTVPYAWGGVVCGLAVAGVAMRKPNRKTRSGGPLHMSASWDDEDERLYRDGILRGPVQQVFQNKNMAYVVVFNKGTRKEGVYTLQTNVGAAKAQLLTFENPADAERFAERLQQEQFNVGGTGSFVSLAPQPHIWDARRIAEFCRSGGFEVALVRNGGKIAPPEYNTYDQSQFGTRRGPAYQSGPRGMQEGGPHDWSPPVRGYDQRRRAQDILRKTKASMSPQQRRGQEVWSAAMRNAHLGRGAGQMEICGQEECGFDELPGERNLLEYLYEGGEPREDGPSSGPGRPGPFGPSGPPGGGPPGSWGPGGTPFSPPGTWGP